MIISTLAASFAIMATPATVVDFPPIVKDKTLYAANDLRGQKAPELIVEKWLTDKPETKGKVVMIDFWATWCGPCRASIPELNEWHKKFKDDLVIIGLSKEEAAVVSEFTKGTAMNYPLAIDTEGRLASKVGVQGIPHALVISKDGIVRWQGFPGLAADKLTTEVMQQIISANKALKVD